MLRHSDIWRAIDIMALKYCNSASDLARKAGLDPTTFNKSKRTTRDGKLRWPSTESIAKILEATGANLDELVGYIVDGETSTPVKRVPLIGFAQAGSGGYFDDAGYPTGGGWDEISFPEVQDKNAFALEIAGDSMLPVYRDGDVVIVSPEANIRRGDRVIVKTTAGEILAKELRRRSALRIELASLNPAYEDRVLDMQNVVWIHRIIWAAQ